MQLENEFTVPAAIDEAWAVLLDVARVAPCLPGAAVEPGGGDEGEYNGTMTVKIGPITARYKGTVKIQEADEAARRAVMRAQAKDARGQGTAAATITSTMEEAPEGTKVKVVTDMRVTGPAAQFGRGVMQDVSAKMMRQFAECLASEMSGPAETWSEAGEAAAEPETVDGREVGASPGTQEPTGGAGVTSSTGAVGRPETAPGEKPGAEAKPRPTPEVLDLADASREAVLKRAAPAVGAMFVLILLWRLLRR